MSKIGIVGDVHAAPVPKNRIDDYFETVLDKIQQIAINCDHVIFMGDFFSSARIEEKYVNATIRFLNTCKINYNVEFYTIFGNHDIQSENETNVDDSSLGTLESSGVIKIIKTEQPLCIDGYRFNTAPVNFKRLQKYLPTVKYTNDTHQDILLLHHEFETGSNCVRYEDLAPLNTSMVFFGHDHRPLDGGRKIYNEFTAYRSGSLLRNRADDYNLTRSIYYYILEDGVVKCASVNVKSAKDVFTNESFTRENYNKTKFVESLGVVLDKYSSNINTQSKFSIKTILEELNTPLEYVEHIKKKYEKLGERFD